MEEIISHYILKENNKIEVPIIAEDRKGNKLYRGQEVVIINEVFLTDKNTYFNGEISKFNIPQEIYMEELTIKAVNDYVTLSEEMNDKLNELFKRIKSNI